VRSLPGPNRRDGTNASAWWVAGQREQTAFVNMLDDEHGRLRVRGETQGKYEPRVITLLFVIHNDARVTNWAGMDNLNNVALH
jgi:hypothetical protein